VRFHLRHIPDDHFDDADMVLHGHTHVPRHESVSGVVRLNPGAVTRPRQATASGFAWLTLGPDRNYSWRRELL
jgi:predicted phosphodiesterase